MTREQLQTKIETLMEERFESELWGDTEVVQDITIEIYELEKQLSALDKEA